MTDLHADPTAALRQQRDQIQARLTENATLRSQVAEQQQELQVAFERGGAMLKSDLDRLEASMQADVNSLEQYDLAIDKLTAGQAVALETDHHDDHALHRLADDGGPANAIDQLARTQANDGGELEAHRDGFGHRQHEDNGVG